MNVSNEALRQALNHAFDMGVLEAISKSNVLAGVAGADARGKRQDEILDATIPAMRQTTRGLMAWLAQQQGEGNA